MNLKLLRNTMFMVLIVVGFIAAREASLRGEADCWACTGIFGETCEPCQGGEDCARGCFKTENTECPIFGEVCYATEEL